MVVFLARTVNLDSSFLSAMIPALGMPFNVPVVDNCIPKGKRPDTTVYTNVPPLESYASNANS